MDQAEPGRMKPLSGVRILSIEQFAAGPYGTLLLAGMGAEVLKIENAAIGGDPARHTGPHMLGVGDSQYFQTWNLGKKSITLDLKAQADRRRFERLVEGADAVVNNLRGDQPSKLGLEYAQLGQIKRSIVCLHISAYGRDNARAAWPGYDYLMQAEAGLMSLTGEPGGPPVRFGSPSPMDYSTALTSMVGLLGAMLGAQRTGVGCDVDVCLLDVALHQLGYAATWQLNAGGGAERQARSSHYSIAPSQTFPTRDGWIFVMCITPKFWEALLRVIGRPELADDPRFKTNPDRFANRNVLTEILDVEFLKRTTAEWLQALSGVLPVAPVYGLAEAMANPFLTETGMIQQVAHPACGQLKVLASPIRVDGERATFTVCPPLGADNAEVLGEPAPAAE
jgi:crotonobetainyl-CoA:carnitine CoA-transferase CaiB-like acyl-CoA transferase